MRLVLDFDPRLHLIRSYGAGVLVIGERRLVRPCLVTPHRLLADWNAQSADSLSESELEPLWALGCDIVLLGSGERQIIAAAPLRAAFAARRVALESMSLGAACRTYNILAGEGRNVTAALFP